MTLRLTDIRRALQQDHGFPVDGRSVSDAASDAYRALAREMLDLGAKVTGAGDRIAHLEDLAHRPAAVHNLDQWGRAVQALSRLNRPGDAATITALRGHNSKLSTQDSDTVDRALSAICDATATLDTIPEKLRNAPNEDGTTPEADAAAVLDSATAAINAAAQAVVDGEVDQLRVLRRYAQQWTPDKDLDLHDTREE